MNRVTLIGRLGADPEVRYTQSGSAVASFRVATSERWKDKDGQKQESTEWSSCVAWGKLAEICGEHLTKGMQVMVSGKLQTRKWQDQSGMDRYTTEIIVKEMEMLGGKGGEKSAGGNDRTSQYQGYGEDVPF